MTIAKIEWRICGFGRQLQAARFSDLHIVRRTQTREIQDVDRFVRFVGGRAHSICLVWRRRRLASRQL